MYSLERTVSPVYRSMRRLGSAGHVQIETAPGNGALAGSLIFTGWKLRATHMDVKIEERVVGQVTILDIVGRLTIDEAAQHLKDKINSLISQNRLQLVLNLARVPYIDSGGLGQLVASYGSVKRASGIVKLLNVNSRNHDLLSITRLVTLFESFDSETEAVQSFDTLAPSAAVQ